jgi:hypothetical protein
MLWAKMPGVSDLVFMNTQARIKPEKNTGISAPMEP